MDACWGSGFMSNRDLLMSRRVVISTPRVGPKSLLPGEIFLIDSFSKGSNYWEGNDWLVNRWHHSVGASPLTSPSYNGTPWANGSGVWEQPSYPYGPGFQMKARHECEVDSGGKKAQMFVHAWPGLNPSGYTFYFSGYMMLPALGNPSGWVGSEASWNQMFEIHFLDNGATPSGSGGTLMQIGIKDDASPSRWYFKWYDPVSNSMIQTNAVDSLEFDRWYSWQFNCRFSTGSDGWIEHWWDGIRVFQRTNQQTIDSNVGVGVQFGVYTPTNAGIDIMNECRYSGLSIRKVVN
jgi:hypothetical protein